MLRAPFLRPPPKQRAISESIINEDPKMSDTKKTCSVLVLEGMG